MICPIHDDKPQAKDKTAKASDPMTNDEIRIKIAEAMGWKGISPDYLTGYAPWRPTLYSKRIMGDLDSIPLNPLPDYPEDLNACAEFEDELKKLGVFSSYLSNLALVCGFNAQGDEAWFKLHAGLEAVCSSTARQRCIAYLKTKGILP